MTLRKPCGSLAEAAEVDFRNPLKPAEILAEALCGSLRKSAEAPSETRRNPCGSLRKCCGSRPSPYGGAFWGAPPRGIFASGATA